MRLGIVGHAAEKFTPETEAIARRLIVEAIDKHKPERVVSGRSPMGGIDVWAEEIAGGLGVGVTIFPPAVTRWDAKGGFKERNLQIASSSDLVLCIVVKDLPPGFRGMRFPTCYHCKDRNPPHIKSGGCWTAWRCKDRVWEIIG